MIVKRAFYYQPNTSYQFRMWANNEVGSGDISIIHARTVAPTEEKGTFYVT
jgi:hypothetical protein